jgi:hypothetical protein
VSLALRGKRIGIEKLKKQSKKDVSFYVDVDTDEFLGIVRFLGPEAPTDLSVGDKIYFGGQFHPIKLGGLDLCIMEDSNILAKVL